jgi:hypothetical protein
MPGDLESFFLKPNFPTLHRNFSLGGARKLRPDVILGNTCQGRKYRYATVPLPLLA